MPSLKSYKRLPTEQNNSKSGALDQMSIDQILRLINNEDLTVPRIVGRQIPQIRQALQLIVSAFEKRGRLFFLGAGTSGRFGILEAAECPPTFNTPPSMVQAFMAGGRSSVFKSKEGAEDRGEDSRAIVGRKMKAGDVLVGIAASGVTAFVKEGLAAARAKKIKTILVTCNPTVSRSLANVVIALNTGAEVIAGSTRLKAGTATKLVLNMLTVTSMVQIGKVFGNRMVDLQPRSKKLEARALHLIEELANVSGEKAAQLMKAARGNAKTAILMAKKNITAVEAQARLANVRGHLRRAL